MISNTLSSSMYPWEGGGMICPSRKSLTSLVVPIISIVFVMLVVFVISPLCLLWHLRMTTTTPPAPLLVRSCCCSSCCLSFSYPSTQTSFLSTVLFVQRWKLHCYATILELLPGTDGWWLGFWSNTPRWFYCRTSIRNFYYQKTNWKRRFHPITWYKHQWWPGRRSSHSAHPWK